ncbi:uncharacterized protein CANTADRAFT_5473 [Suhomyces tanzawaensis NRRL Y-17324]|uniref:Uncharacterized protein n=1 Tax=Suhomyces tanzawaensis NRRL Y-17324 TaxID=984487 RepID=A0A1E4SJS3_9ASCO|nr:uncharacterized protein CANTADRAFT_5473 [Suhomyces tanzawaensis NRRL Y-17324]ODV79756.1 hypothetical protein CANTADRAFT_5473 [Suhomyces tanzawaensis NRRL Y-17324]
MGEELKDYLLYANFSQQLFLASHLNLTNMNQDVPQRSPARQFNVTKQDLLLASPALDTSSFESKRMSNSSLSDESIFSQHDEAPAPPPDEFGLRLDFEDWESLLDEIQVDQHGRSSVVCKIDDVVTILGEHQGSQFRASTSLKDRRTKTLSYINVA